MPQHLLRRAGIARRSRPGAAGRVLAVEHGLELGDLPGQLGLAGAQRLLGGLHRLQVGDAHPEELLPAVADHGAVDRVDVDEATFAVGDEEAFQRRVEDGPLEERALLQAPGAVRAREGGRGMEVVGQRSRCEVGRAPGSTAGE